MRGTKINPLDINDVMKQKEKVTAVASNRIITVLTPLSMHPKEEEHD